MKKLIKTLAMLAFMLLPALCYEAKAQPKEEELGKWIDSAGIKTFSKRFTTLNATTLIDSNRVMCILADNQEFYKLELQSGKILNHLKFPNRFNHINQIAFDDSNRVMSLLADNQELYNIDLQSGKILNHLKFPNRFNHINQIAFDDTNRVMSLLADDQEFYKIDLQSGKILHYSKFSRLLENLEGFEPVISADLQYFAHFKYLKKIGPNWEVPNCTIKIYDIATDNILIDTTYKETIFEGGDAGGAIRNLNVFPVFVNDCFVINYLYRYIVHIDVSSRSGSDTIIIKKKDKPVKPVVVNTLVPESGANLSFFSNDGMKLAVYKTESSRSHSPGSGFIYSDYCKIDLMDSNGLRNVYRHSVKNYSGDFGGLEKIKRKLKDRYPLMFTSDSKFLVTSSDNDITLYDVEDLKNQIKYIIDPNIFPSVRPWTMSTSHPNDIFFVNYAKGIGELRQYDYRTFKEKEYYKIPSHILENCRKIAPDTFLTIDSNNVFYMFSLSSVKYTERLDLEVSANKVTTNDIVNFKIKDFFGMSDIKIDFGDGSFDTTVVSNHKYFNPGRYPIIISGKKSNGEYISKKNLNCIEVRKGVAIDVEVDLKYVGDSTEIVFKKKDLSAPNRILLESSNLRLHNILQLENKIILDSIYTTKIRNSFFLAKIRSSAIDTVNNQEYSKWDYYSITGPRPSYIVQDSIYSAKFVKGSAYADLGKWKKVIYFGEKDPHGGDVVDMYLNYACIVNNCKSATTIPITKYYGLSAEIEVLNNKYHLVKVQIDKRTNKNELNITYYVYDNEDRLVLREPDTYLSKYGFHLALQDTLYLYDVVLKQFDLYSLKDMKPCGKLPFNIKEKIIGGNKDNINNELRIYAVAQSKEKPEKSILKIYGINSENQPYLHSSSVPFTEHYGNRFKCLNLGSKLLIYIPENSNPINTDGIRSALILDFLNKANYDIQTVDMKVYDILKVDDSIAVLLGNNKLLDAFNIRLINNKSEVVKDLFDRTREGAFRSGKVNPDKSLTLWGWTNDNLLYICKTNSIYDNLSKVEYRENREVSVFPNPCSNEFNIESPIFDENEAMIISLEGKEYPIVYLQKNDKNNTNNRRIIDTRDLPNGNYILVFGRGHFAKFSVMR